MYAIEEFDKDLLVCGEHGGVCEVIRKEDFILLNVFKITSTISKIAVLESGSSLAFATKDGL